jgi:hypothetical protein
LYFIRSSSYDTHSIVIDQYLKLSNLEDSFDELIKNVRNMIDRNRSNDAMIQLFEYICQIRSYIPSTIDPLKQRLENSNDKYFQGNNQSEIELHSKNLEKVYNMCQFTKTLLDVNKNRQANNRLFGSVTTLFFEFYHHLQVFLNQSSKRIQPIFG